LDFLIFLSQALAHAKTTKLQICFLNGLFGWNKVSLASSILLLTQAACNHYILHNQDNDNKNLA